MEEQGTDVSEIADQIKGLLPIIIILAAVGGGIYWYMFLLPKPGIVYAEVTELDGGAINGVELTLYDGAGKQVGDTTVSADGGMATFTNVPSGAISLLVGSRPGYTDAGRVSGTLESGGTTTIPVKLTKSIDRISIGLDAASTAAISSLTANCAQPITMQIVNSGDTPYVADLVVEPEEDAKLVVLDSTTVEVPAQDAKPIKGSIIVPNINVDNQETLQKNIKIRLKGTQKAAVISLNVDSKNDLQLSTQGISISEKDSHQETITLTNNGKKPITKLSYVFQLDSGLQASCGEDGSGCFTLTWPNGDDGTPVTTLLPGESRSMGFKFTNRGITGKYYAFLRFAATCLSTDIPLNVDVAPDTG